MNMYRVLFAWILLALSGSSAVVGDITILGPSPYLKRDDSPFDMSSLGSSFFLEDFEDSEINFPPGAPLVNGYIREPASSADSVDADDGSVDQSGNLGHSFVPTFLVVGLSDPPIWYTSISMTFFSDTLPFRQYPNSFGIVITDGMPGGRIRLTVFESDDGEHSHLFVPFPFDSLDDGNATEDRFVGVTSDTEIEAILIEHFYASSFYEERFEVDHVQFGVLVPEPSPAFGICVGLICAVFPRGLKRGLRDSEERKWQFMERRFAA
jgi:hypothetical protein